MRLSIEFDMGLGSSLVDLWPIKSAENSLDHLPGNKLFLELGLFSMLTVCWTSNVRLKELLTRLILKSSHRRMIMSETIALCMHELPVDFILSLLLVFLVVDGRQITSWCIPSKNQAVG